MRKHKNTILIIIATAFCLTIQGEHQVIHAQEVSPNIGKIERQFDTQNENAARIERALEVRRGERWRRSETLEVVVAMDLLVENRKKAMLILDAANRNIEFALEKARREARRAAHNDKIFSYLSFLVKAYTFAVESTSYVRRSNLVETKSGNATASSEQKRVETEPTVKTIAIQPDQTIDYNPEPSAGVDRLKRNLKWLDDNAPDYNMEPGLELTEAEHRIQDSLQIFTKLEPTIADKFAEDNKLTLERWLMEQAPGPDGQIGIPEMAEKRFSSILGALKLFFWAQPTGDGEPGAKVHREFVWKKLEQHALDYWRWRTREPLPNSGELNFFSSSFDVDRIQEDLDCRQGCIRDPRSSRNR